MYTGTFSVAQESAPAIRHIKDPHLESVVGWAADQQRLPGQGAQAAHSAAMRIAHLTGQLALLQVPECYVTSRRATQHHRKAWAQQGQDYNRQGRGLDPVNCKSEQFTPSLYGVSDGFKILPLFFW